MNLQVNALDGRCNIRGVNKLGKMKLQELPTTLKVFKSLKDCERIYASDGKLRFLEFPRQTPKGNKFKSIYTLMILIFASRS